MSRSVHHRVTAKARADSKSDSGNAGIREGKDKRPVGALGGKGGMVGFSRKDLNQ